MSKDREKILESELEEIRSKYNDLNNELSYILTSFEFCYIDTNSELRIIKIFGAADTVFIEGKEKLKVGENLIKLINKVTKTNSAYIDSLDHPSDESQSIDFVVNRFIDSKKNEINIKVMGEKEDGELFLLNWKIIKKENNLRNYFKIIPTNQIIKHSQHKYIQDFENFKNVLRTLIFGIDVGVVILDISQRIHFINDIAKKHFLPNQNTLIKNANFENKLFRDLLFMCDQDEMNYRLDINKSVIETKSEMSYNRNLDGYPLEFKVIPVLNTINEINSIVIVSKLNVKNSTFENIDVRKLIYTIKHFSNQNKILFERISELETNQKWFMKNNLQYEATIKTLYSHIENIPYPVSIMEMPSQNFILVNNAFLKTFNKEKKEVLGKNDSEIFPSSWSDLLINANIECEKNKSTTMIQISDDALIKQTPYLDIASSRTLIIRIYIINSIDFKL